MSRYRGLLLSGILSAAVTHSALAVENGSSNYPPGSAGSNFAILPPFPGIFLLDETEISNSGGLYGNDGKKLSIPPFKSSAIANAQRFLFSYPVTLPGNGHLYSQLVFPEVSLNTEIFGQKSYTSGLSNITVSPAIASWQVLKNLTTTTGLDLILPNGAYSQTKISVANGYMTYSPVLAFRYNDLAGLDIGGSQRLLINDTNGRTGYHSGSVFESDFMGAWNFGNLKVGGVGGFQYQYTDDQYGNGTKPLGGNRIESLNFGPVITYNALIGGVFPLNINVNYQKGIFARNTALSDNFWFNVAVPVFVPHPPPPPVAAVSPAAS